jgi:glycosyltransferase involved in cell wall biosynthesis
MNPPKPPMSPISPMSPIPPIAQQAAQPLVSVVVIGRNEGERLSRCLASIQAMHAAGFQTEMIYVDSASTDGSPAQAAELGAQVIDVRPERPSAALGRNAGWRAAQGEFILFLDGDTVLHPDFVSTALAKMNNPEVAIVWGHRREMNPEQSVYVRVLDLDWIYPPGESEFCGGDALMRRNILEAVDGFDATLIAGEEPELCRRIRSLGRVILHIDAPMTLHDLAINRFAPYWKRAFRAGHAYAEVAHRYRDSSDPLWLAETRRNQIHGAALLAAPWIVFAAALTQPWLAGGLLLGGLALLARSAHRCTWKSPRLSTRLLYAVHSHFQQIPILFGQIAWRLDAWRGRQRQLIEYKQMR